VLVLVYNMGKNSSNKSVRVVAGKSGEKPLGEELFAKLVAKTNIPVYAMGGTAAKDQTKIRQLGVSGITGVNSISGVEITSCYSAV